MSMEGEILQRLRDHEDRLRRLEAKAELLPPGSDAKAIAHGLQTLDTSVEIAASRLAAKRGDSTVERAEFLAAVAKAVADAKGVMLENDEYEVVPGRHRRAVPVELPMPEKSGENDLD